MVTKKTYSEKLLDPRWQKKRLKILERDKWKCTYCQCATETLHVHHKTYRDNPLDSPNKDLITVCKHCHSIIEYCKKSNRSLDSIERSILSSEWRVSYVSCNTLSGYWVSIFKIENGKINHIITIDKEVIETMYDSLKFINLF